MKEKTLLDKMAVLAATKGKDDSGALILADDDWLTKSIFPGIWVHRDIIPVIAEPLNEGERFYTGVRVSDSGWPITIQADNQGTLALNTFYLIDEATTQLAKEIDKVRAENSDRLRPLTEDDLRYEFREAIAHDVLVFLFDELPKTLVELLGHNFKAVAHHFFEIQQLYQLLHLLAERKAGIGADTFMYHHDYYKGDPDGPYFTLQGNTETLFFRFSVESIFLITDYKGEYEDWFYLNEYRKLFPERDPLDFFNIGWQYLSIKEKGFRRAPLQKELITDCILSLSRGNLAEAWFAKGVVKMGLTSCYWKGVWYPELDLD